MRFRVEYLGANAVHSIAAAEPSPEMAKNLAEVVLRFGVHDLKIAQHAVVPLLLRFRRWH